MSEDNKYSYCYENENFPKKEEQCCSEKENKHCPEKEEQCCPEKENKHYPMKGEQYYPMQENRPYPKKEEQYCPMQENRPYPRKEEHYYPMQENRPYPRKEEQYYPMNECKHCAKKKDNCCCKLSLRRALEILSSDRMCDTINFNAAAFITDFFIAGSDLDDMGNFRHDNLDNMLSGSLDTLDPCDCDLLEISGKIFYPVEDNNTDEPDDLHAKFVSLCSIKAMAFDVHGSNCHEQNKNFELIKDILRCFKCDEKDCRKSKCDDCCCGNGVVNKVMAGKISGKVGLTAGSLALRKVDILGCIGNVLILGNRCKTVSGPDINARIFLVCSEAVQFIF